jgi:hypothetical protein
MGGKDIKVMARRPRPYFKGFALGLEDAEEEQVQIIINHSAPVLRDRDGRPGRHDLRTAGVPDRREGHLASPGHRRGVPGGGRRHPGHRPGGAFPYIERDIGIEFDKWGMAVVDKKTFQSTRPGVFFGGDAAWGPENIIWAVAHGHQAAISIDNYCRGVDVSQRPPHG